MIKKLLANLFKRRVTITKEKEFVANTKVSPKDKRDYLPVFTSNQPLPETYVIPNLPPIRNQGALNSCRSHSVIRELEIQLWNKGIKFDGSELYHYFMARKYVNNTFPGDKGMTMRDGCEAVRLHGLAAESLHPYSPTKVNEEPGYFAKGLAHLFGITRYERLFTVDDIKRSVHEGIPVGIGVFVDKEFMSYKSGVWSPKVKGTLGGHAVTIVGWNKDGFIIDNSWGSWWGKNGQFVMSYDSFLNFSFDWFRCISK
jgi:C1A family cysteine protease